MRARSSILNIARTAATIAATADPVRIPSSLCPSDHKRIRGAHECGSRLGDTWRDVTVFAVLTVEVEKDCPRSAWPLPHYTVRVLPSDTGRSVSVSLVQRFRQDPV